MKRKGKFLKLRSKVGPMHWPPLSLSLLDAVLVLGLDTVRSSFTWLLAIHMCFITLPLGCYNHMGSYHARCCLVKTSLGKPKTQGGKNGNHRQEKEYNA